ncbi:MAG: 23S rRNA (guanosine(2251)-2'-O)-methyltransferase RlmB [Patescibacteria group bacterium]|jgi:23S rRNA (guanosine2251-2'-O)-methyltransferase
MGVKRPSKRFTKEQFRQIEGRNPVREALRAGTPLKQILIEEQIKFDDRIYEIYRLAKSSGVPIVRMNSKKLRRLSKTEGHHQGVIAQAEVQEEKNLKVLLDEIYAKGKAPFFVILADVTYEHNLGAVLRSAEAAGVDAVITSNRGLKLTPVVSRTAVGAEEHIPFIHENLFTTIKLFKKEGITIFGAKEGDSRSIFRTNFKRGVALVIGGEDKGISEPLAKLIDENISIPMLGKIESLNLSVAAAICLYEVVRQRKYEENRD